jgi:hypothetical protein
MVMGDILVEAKQKARSREKKQAQEVASTAA